MYYRNMLCSNNIILPSKCNVKLQKKIWEFFSEGGSQDLGQGAGGDFFRGGGGTLPVPPFGHVCNSMQCSKYWSLGVELSLL
jgi:hypothetical protein